MNVETLEDGKSVIAIFMARKRTGLEVNVKIAQDIEEFFKHWGGGGKQPTILSGRRWKGNNLEVWDMLGYDEEEEDSKYTIHRIGQELILDGSRVNISFLRLVGASSVTGVTFVVDDVISRPGLERLSRKVTLACTKFYEE
jgi:hypothetical protein